MSDETKSSAGRNWPKDVFALSEIFFLGVLTRGFVIIALVGVVVALGCSSRKTVIAYCAQDQVYAEPIFNDFQKLTGIKVRAVFDSEAVKTVGLANRLLAERDHPQCDVYWGNEEMRARLLSAAGVFRETNGWVAFGHRSRRMVINTNQLTMATAPKSLLELTNATWRGKVAIAYPQFGTTSAQVHALRQRWGSSGWESWCRALAANKPLLVDGNSVVVKTVGRGDAWVGLTDSDDIAAGQDDGLPVAALPMDEETLLIPNTVAVTRRAPHEAAAEQLFEFLQRPEIVQRLVAAKALEGLSLSDATTRTLQPNWDLLLKEIDETTRFLNATFLR